MTGLAAMPPPDDATYHAFLWDGTKMRDLGTLGGSTSSGIDINDSGQVTGLAENSLGQGRAFLWDGNAMKDLGALGGPTSNAEPSTRPGR